MEKQSTPFMVGWRERIRIFLLFTFALVSVELAHDLYRLYAFGSERAQLRVLNTMVDAAGVEVVRTQIEEDSLRSRIELMDVALEGSRGAFAGYDKRARDGVLTEAAYQEYRGRIASYNDQVAVRNSWFARWQRASRRNRDAVKQYNRLADEIRSIAAQMGEQHYNIPSPVEAAVKSGLHRE
ncbi:MAG: hypothetical protein KY464_10460 [Gemmatimonadetes bacterium]|nr:hypothetical protein [Gemmatimonadota bacterium]